VSIRLNGEINMAQFDKSVLRGFNPR
jgi:hypothetical protein